MDANIRIKPIRKPQIISHITTKMVTFDFELFANPNDKIEIGIIVVFEEGKDGSTCGKIRKRVIDCTIDSKAPIDLVFNTKDLTRDPWYEFHYVMIKVLSSLFPDISDSEKNVYQYDIENTIFTWLKKEQIRKW